MTWPNTPLITIDKGTCRDIDISGTTAAIVDVDYPEFGYYLLDGPLAGYSIREYVIGEGITAWRPCAAIPVAELTFMRNVFMGAELSKNQLEAIQSLFSYLPKAATDESEWPASPEDRIQ